MFTLLILCLFFCRNTFLQTCISVAMLTGLTLIKSHLSVFQVVHHVYLKPERLIKRSFSNNLQLKIKIIYDNSIDRSVKTQSKTT